MNKILLSIVGLVGLVSVVVSVSTDTALAHPGNTASDGCHYCRTNCDRWGETHGARHCHGGSSRSSGSSSQEDGVPIGWWLLGGSMAFLLYSGYKDRN